MPVEPKDYILPRRKKPERKFLRYLLAGLGGTAMISAATNLCSALSLLEPSDEQALGISRNYVVATYTGIFVAGGALVWMALRKSKKPQG